MPSPARKRTPKPAARSPKAKPAPVEKPKAKLAAVLPMPIRRPALQAATLLSFEARGRARFADGEEIEVGAHASVDPVVLRGAAARGEVVIVQESPAGWVVLGALRTRATPGVDRAEEYVIEADRVKVEAAHAVSLVAGAAEIAVRAVGFVETIARDITARAAGVHKIVGRMIHLN